MTSSPTAIAAADKGHSRLHRRWPALTLLVLSPLIGEVLSGATKISTVVFLIPEIMVWGWGTLVIREAALRWRAGWSSVLLLALGLSIAEEFIIQQTSIAPLPFEAAKLHYGRAGGVNWVYFLYMLGFEAVWIVLVPIQVTRLIFRERRDEPWVRQRRSFITGTIVFALGSFVAWYGWTQQARAFLKAPKYDPPLHLLAAGLGAILLLIAAAWSMRNAGPRATIEVNRTVPNGWVLGLTAFVLGSAWWLLLVLVFVPFPVVSAPIALIIGMGWAALALVLFHRWGASFGWDDTHRWALVFGAACACMAGGFVGSNYWPRADLIGKIVLNVVAVILLLVLRRRLGPDRSSTSTARQT